MGITNNRNVKSGHGTNYYGIGGFLQEHGMGFGIGAKYQSNLSDVGDVWRGMDVEKYAGFWISGSQVYGSGLTNAGKPRTAVDSFRTMYYNPQHPVSEDFFLNNSPERLDSLYLQFSNQ